MIFSPRLVQRLNQRTSCVATDDFFNTIDPKQTFLMLAAVFVSMFAIFCGVTGLLFIASEPGR